MSAPAYAQRTAERRALLVLRADAEARPERPTLLYYDAAHGRWRNAALPAVSPRRRPPTRPPYAL